MTMTSTLAPRGASALLLGLAVLAATRAAAADEPVQEPPARAAFGDRGELLVSADRLVPLLGYTTQSITARQGDVTTTVTDDGTSVALLFGREPGLGSVHTVPRVAFDFTVLRRVTLGTSIIFAFGLGGDHSEERTSSVEPTTKRESRAPLSTIVGFAPRAGYVLPLGARFALWPRAGLGFYSVSSKSEETSNLGVTSTTRVTDTVFSLDLDAQLVWLPTPHVFLNVGPLVNVPLTGAHDTTFSQAFEAKERSDDLSLFRVGVAAGFGAWFDL
jgi:hypothetical protein